MEGLLLALCGDCNGEMRIESRTLPENSLPNAKPVAQARKHCAQSDAVVHNFCREAVSWRVNREMISLLAGGRALLMQVAHPKVAAGVAEHSHFKEDPLGRLGRTMNTMWSIVFDEMPVAQASLERIRSAHRRVRGVVGRNESPFAGARYDAFDPELLLWVHATLIDSGLVAHDQFVEPLSQAEAARYYEESKSLAQLFEIPERIVPHSLADFQSYMEAMLAGNQISVGPTARSLAQEILYPPTWFLKPAAPLHRLITAGLLPAKLREAYALRWSGWRARKFQLAAGTIRTLLPLVPKPLRIVPQARAAERRALKGGVME